MTHKEKLVYFVAYQQVANEYYYSIKDELKKLAVQSFKEKNGYYKSNRKNKKNFDNKLIPDYEKSIDHKSKRFEGITNSLINQFKGTLEEKQLDNLIEKIYGEANK